MRRVVPVVLLAVITAAVAITDAQQPASARASSAQQAAPATQSPAKPAPPITVSTAKPAPAREMPADIVGEEITP